ncbi:MAG: branched-chain amino acid ABC transporter permease, partial [Desulfobacteraceae bacterium]
MDGAPLFLQQLFNGLTIGGIYALIAVGYTMVYGVIQLINFAHGEIYMLGAFFAMSFIIFLGMPFYLAFLLAMACGAVCGMLLDVIAYRPLRRSPRLAALITA